MQYNKIPFQDIRTGMMPREVTAVTGIKPYRFQFIGSCSKYNDRGLVKPKSESIKGVNDINCIMLALYGKPFTNNQVQV